MITVEVNKQQKEKPKDIFFRGNYVISDKRNLVQVSGVSTSDEDCFEGQIINDGSDFYFKGQYKNTWIKKNFTQFTGTITITSK